MFGPDRFAPRLHNVSLDELAARGIRGLILDLDNTMVAYRQSEIVQDHLTWVEEAHARGFKMVMLSNNFTDRVTTVGIGLGIHMGKDLRLAFNVDQNNRDTQQFEHAYEKFLVGTSLTYGF